MCACGCLSPTSSLFTRSRSASLQQHRIRRDRIIFPGQQCRKGKQANGNYGFSSFNRSYASLTDGRNFYGDILPIRQWLNELALRHELERQRPQLALRLNELYEEQKSLLNRFTALAVILAAAMIITLLVTRITRMRQLARVRLRLAADLHDELGANLHTIGLLSDLAVESREDDEAFADIQRRIRSESDRSGAESGAAWIYSP